MLIHHWNQFSAKSIENFDKRYDIAYDTSEFMYFKTITVIHLSQTGFKNSPHT